MTGTQGRLLQVVDLLRGMERRRHGVHWLHGNDREFAVTPIQPQVKATFLKTVRQVLADGQKRLLPTAFCVQMEEDALALQNIFLAGF